MKKILDQITDGNGLVHNNKIILYDDSNNIKKLETRVKKQISPPSRDIKVFLYTIVKPKKYKYILMVNICRMTITPKLKLSYKDDDQFYFQTITWTPEEFSKFGLKKKDIISIVRIIKKELISFETNTKSISELLRLIK